MLERVAVTDVIALRVSVVLPPDPAPEHRVRVQVPQHNADQESRQHASVLERKFEGHSKRGMSLTFNRICDVREATSFSTVYVECRTVFLSSAEDCVVHTARYDALRFMR